MPYATIAQLAAAAEPEWLLRAAAGPSATQPDEAIVNDALEGAAAEVDAHMASRHHMPLPVGVATPPLLIEANIILALERLSLRAPGCPLPEGARQRVERIRLLLRDVAQGRLRLPGIPQRRLIASNAEQGLPAPRPLRDGGIGSF